MHKAGICNICGKATIQIYSCWKCGARVCANDFDTTTGLCKRCSSFKKI
ncbi:MAG: orotate phosphoribosyltransferase [Candidatus Aenigmatarchaeota archaeon]|nr:orotate phosphoribosyltransferase [Candidatus Aenigmarchaeota archaeon]